jgi:hypothetical protein
MSDHEQQVSTRSGSFGTALRPVVAFAASLVSVILVATVWNDDGAATGQVSMRIFLVGWAVAAVIVSAGVVFGRSVLPLAVLHVTMGLVIGLAIGTTEWTDLHLAGWWQIWWTVPLILVYASLLVSLRRFTRSSS